MKKLIDLHIHTIYSDGELTPNEVLELVKEKNVGLFSITDHDTLMGVKKLLEIYDEQEIRFITGIEMTGKIDKGKLHILGYEIDVNNEQLNFVLDKLHNVSIEKVKMMIEYLVEKYNIEFTNEELNKLYNPIGDVGSPEIAMLLLKHGYVKSIKEAFEKYLIEAYDQVRNKAFYLEAKEVIELILGANGIPILAHPISLKKDIKELEEYIVELVEYGLAGIEVYHPDQPMEYRIKLLQIAHKYGLVVTGGSDYHGPVMKPHITLGHGINNNNIIVDLNITKFLNDKGHQYVK
jgi:predicted metal-dependent phosphoesterase TrpH